MHQVWQAHSGFHRLLSSHLWAIFWAIICDYTVYRFRVAILRCITLFFRWAWAETLLRLLSLMFAVSCFCSQPAQRVSHFTKMTDWLRDLSFLCLSWKIRVRWHSIWCWVFWVEVTSDNYCCLIGVENWRRSRFEANWWIWWALLWFRAVPVPLYA